MSVTENEAISGLETLKYQCKYNGECGTCNICCSAIPLAIQALEEIQQYKEIGTIEEFKDLKGRVYVDERPFIFICPNCEEIYTLEQDERPSCCRKCNDKIDWNKVIFYQL